MKVLSWIIALLGLWEFGDIAALFVPNFGEIQSYVWNHIIIGLILMLVGARATRTTNARTIKIMHSVAIFAGVWLMISSFILRYPDIGAGFWNDMIVGLIVLVSGIWALIRTSRQRL